MGLADPRERLAEVRRRMRALRASAEPLVVLRVLDAGLAPDSERVVEAIDREVDELAAVAGRAA